MVTHGARDAGFSEHLRELVRLNGCVICSKNGVMTVSCTGCGFRDLTVESGGDAVRCRSRDIPRQQLTDPVDRCSRRERSPGVPGKHGNPIAGGATDNLDVAVRRLSQDWVKSQPARCVGTTAEASQIADGIVASQRTASLCHEQTFDDWMICGRCVILQLIRRLRWPCLER